MPWQDIARQLTADAAKGPVRVLIAGSVFGGTGASVFFPLANWVRRVAGGNQRNLNIGAVALVPYFSFPPRDGATAAAADRRLPQRAEPDARKFSLMTRAAAQFYHQMRATGSWPFSSMFWLGDDSPVDLGYCEGGKDQTNPPHFVELMAAQAILDFCEAPLNQACCSLDVGTSGTGRNIASWKDIPRLPGTFKPDDVKRQILSFLVSGVMHMDFYAPLFQGGPQTPKIRPETIPWYWRDFQSRGLNLSSPPWVGHLSDLSTFLAHHLVWWEGFIKPLQAGPSF